MSARRHGPSSEVAADSVRGTAGDAGAAGAVTIEARTSNQDIEIVGR